MREGVSWDEIVEIIKRYPGRLKTIHLKEYSPTNEKALLGEGEVRWRELIDLCEEVGGTEWYIVEQESYAYPPLVCEALSREFERDTGVIVGKSVLWFNLDHS